MIKGIYVLLFSFFISLSNILITPYLLNAHLCVLNSGIAFGIKVGYEIFLSLFLILLLIGLGCVNNGKLKYIYFSLSVLGLSNLAVRVLYGNVCDYINLFNIYVNISDITIVGIVIVCIWLLIKAEGK